MYVHGLCDRNMGLLPASNRHFTVSTHEVFTCFRSVASIMFTKSEEKWSLLRVCPLFLASFGNLRLADQVQFTAWPGIQRRIIWIFCHESEVSHLVDSSVFCPGFQKGRVPSEKGTFSAVNGPSKGHH